ncbi:MAG: DUF1925 domain-containing protein [Spirochaetales bacterium]|nr:DUF1925 domain-containing protein [Spirochaetales bacterium]
MGKTNSSNNHRFSTLKNYIYYIKKITGSLGIGPALETIISPLEKTDTYTAKDLYVPDEQIVPGLPSVLNVLHWHQPLGNVSRGIYKGIKKLMDVLYEYYLMQLEVWEIFIVNNPSIGYVDTVHLTGTLITWMVQEHPEWLARFAHVVRGTVTGNPDEKPHIELFVSPYFESLASTLPVEEAVRQTKLSIDVMNFLGMKPSGYWLVERIWEPGYFLIFTKELRKLGINKAAIDDHLFYKMTDREIKASGFTMTSFSEKDLRGYFIFDDELREKDPFFILPANRDYRQARPYWLSEIPRKGGRFNPYWLHGYLKGSVSKDKVFARFKNREYILNTFFMKHPFYSFHDDGLEYLIFKDNCISLFSAYDETEMTSEDMKRLQALWEEAQKNKYSGDECLVWAGDGEKPTNLWRYLGDKKKHRENLEYAREWLLGELDAKFHSHYANFLPTDQLLERTLCRGFIRLPFGAYKEMTWWAHTTENQQSLQTIIKKVETLKVILEDYHHIAEIAEDEVISEEELLQYEKLSNTEMIKYKILLNALEKRGRLAHCRNYYKTKFFLSPREEEELDILEKGIPWKNFWLKYAESYKYHRLWLFLYDMTIRHVEDEDTRELILNLLGRATVNCGSWHGVFGGRYLANLRNDIMWGIAAALGIYVYFLEQKGSFKRGDVLLYSFDFSGTLAEELQEAEIVIQGTDNKNIPDSVIITYDMMVIINRKNGGTVYDWIYFNTGNPQSVINTINLIKEPYHEAAREMVAWFKEKIEIYEQLIKEMDPYLSDWEKYNFAMTHNNDPHSEEINTLDYSLFQDKISSLKNRIAFITKEEPTRIKIISLYSELCKRPDFAGTKTLTKPIQNLNVVKALKDYDTGLPVNHVARLQDVLTKKEVGSFSTADFTLVSTKEEKESYNIILQKKEAKLEFQKEIHISKISPCITVVYRITADDQPEALELEIENNTNISYIDNEDVSFEINNRKINISGKYQKAGVSSFGIINNDENCTQRITIDPDRNRLLIQPRYSVSQGLRLFETTLQYLRYSFLIPVSFDNNRSFSVSVTHFLDSKAREAEENKWIMNL